ncbi:IMCp domain-containing protein [Endozoicomonas ascidiicola]|uniref:IMCp domain-containing protein n=1 Tax=Endozoicomonas ascidiicola TaxID=1698521 RepID=UPI00082EDEC9|nr:IMCp domain-containing protein [Endozoicomonas ascidiicola]
MSTALITPENDSSNNPITYQRVARYLEVHAMDFLLKGMALSIVVFNVMGYKELFNESNSLFGITPFGFLIGLAEFAVLVWTTSVIKNLPSMSRVLKISVVPVVIGFWVLCFTGINSYLKNSAYDDLEQFQTAKTQYANNDVLLKSIDEQIVVAQSALNAAREERIQENSRINELQAEASSISGKMSDRRMTTAVCDENPDCSAAVADYQRQSNNIQRQIDLLYSSVAEKQSQMSAIEAELTDLNKDKRELSKQNRDSINLHAQSESSFSVKKQTYEDIVIGVYELFGFQKPDDPFSIFIGFISFIIYPVYLLLNLYSSLGSTANREIREAKKKVRLAGALRKAEIKAEIAVEKELAQKENRKIRSAIAKEKRILAHKKAMDKINYDTTNRGKLLKYLRVWANRRQKTRNIEVIKEVEIEIEVEKLVEKPVEVIIEKEVKVEVERIVQVEKEVPVYVDRVKKVSEPVFITEPQVVIHERIIPVPEGISAKELEELLAGLPALNEVTKNEPKMTVVQ